MSKRKLSDWLQAYAEYTENTEPPASYHTWTGISVIAGALQRKVYMDWNFQRIFPNMYIVLVGPSGRCKKGTAMNLGKDIMSKIKGINYTANAMTKEALIKRFKESESSFTDPDAGKVAAAGNLYMHSSLTCFSDELSVFLGNNDIKFLSSLTDWYDSHENWEYETVGRGKEDLKGICLNLLGGTAPDWFQSILPEEAVGGGFTSRIFFIVEERKRKTVPHHQVTPHERKLREYLIADLERINALKGFYTFSESALEQYVEWYKAQDIAIDRGQLPVTDPRFAGYCDRRATHIKKLCMVVAASAGDTLIIDWQHFETAREMMEAAEVNMPRAFSSLGSNVYLKSMDKVIRYMQKLNKVIHKRSTILQQFHKDIDLQTWEYIKNQLEMMKYIDVYISPQGGEEEYKWKGPLL